MLHAHVGNIVDEWLSRGVDDGGVALTMDRRMFIGATAVGALMLSSRANAQRTANLPRVALLNWSGYDAEMLASREYRAFVEGLRDLGLIDGRNIVIERRSAEGRREHLPSLLREVLLLQVAVIVVSG